MLTNKKISLYISILLLLFTSCSVNNVNNKDSNVQILPVTWEKSSALEWEVTQKGEITIMGEINNSDFKKPENPPVNFK